LEYTNIKKIDSVGTFPFDEYLVLGFSKKWLKIFGGPPKFDAYLDDN